MHHNFVIIAYDGEGNFVEQLEDGPFNEVTDFFYYKVAIKRLKKHLDKKTIACLQPFDLEQQGMDLEEVEGWGDPVFLKGKQNAANFLVAFEAFHALLPSLMEQEDWTFYAQRMEAFVIKLKTLVNKEITTQLTFYDLYS